GVLRAGWRGRKFVEPPQCHPRHAQQTDAGRDGKTGNKHDKRASRCTQEPVLPAWALSLRRSNEAATESPQIAAHDVEERLGCGPGMDLPVARNRSVSDGAFVAIWGAIWHRGTRSDCRTIDSRTRYETIGVRSGCFCGEDGRGGRACRTVVLLRRAQRVVIDPSRRRRGRKAAR